ncbi:MAG: GHKL domain-containing protein [Anaerostipes sp.]|nr:GHKL domain-containing protein [Anaerostipes sp.]
MWEMGKEIGYWMQIYLVEILKLYLLTRFVFGGETKCKSNKIICTIHIVAFVEIVICVYNGFGQNLENRIQSIIFIIYISILFYNVLYGFLSYLFITLLDFAIGLFYIWVFEIKYQTAYESYIFSLFVGITSLVLLSIIALIRKKKIKQNVSYYEKTDYIIGNILLFGILACEVPLMGAVFRTTNVHRRGQALIGIVIVFFVICIWIQGYRKVKTKKQEYENKLVVQEKYLEQQKEYYESLLNKERETKKFRHDIKQQLRCIYELEEQNKKEELHDYLSEMLKTTENIKTNIETGNEIANVVVNDIFKDCDLKIEWKGLLPQKLNMKQSDVCVLFANLMKNAKEATQKTNYNTIWIDVKQYNGNINIFIKNPVNEKVGVKKNQLETTKVNKDIHGFGTENIRKIIDTYNGKLKYKCNDEHFETDITFYDMVV